MTDGVRHRPGDGGGRFLVEAEGHVARLDYVLDGGVVRIVHTGVPPQIGGRGIGGRLVAAARDWARAQDLEIDPRCPFAAAWLAREDGSGAGPA